MKVALLIHGPYAIEWLVAIKQQILKFKNKFNQIIIVSYIADKDNYENLLRQLRLEDVVQIITVKDLINPGFFNINRQLVSVKAGLEAIEDESIVIKLRNDQCVNFNKLIKYYEDNKIITTNCFTRVDRLYHPSDMLLCGNKKVLLDLFSMPIMQETHLMIELKNKKICEENSDIKYLPIAPESELFRHYLKLKKWDLKETPEDSYNAIKEYYIVVNSWNVDFRWHKQRTNLCPPDYLILPHYFNVAPFQGGPIENVKCYLQTDFTHKLPSIKDIFYLILSKFVWFLWKPNLSKTKKIAYKILYKTLKCLPYFLVEKKVLHYKAKIKNFQ